MTADGRLASSSSWSLDITPPATNDPIYPDQWYLHNTGQEGGVVDADIDAPEAWEITRGSMKTVVAVLDNGRRLSSRGFISKHLPQSR